MDSETPLTATDTHGKSAEDQLLSLLEPYPNEVSGFTFKDGEMLWSCVRRQQALFNKKRRWLASMVRGPDGRIRPVKRPKFLKDVYLPESDVRSDEVSSGRVKVDIERIFGLQCNCYNHHVVQDGIQLFNLQKEKDGSLCPESLKIMQCTVSKLSNQALHSVANIATQSKISFEKNRPTMKKIIKDHLPKYLAELDNGDSKSQLSEILIHPRSYQSDSVSIATPVSPVLLSSIDQALDGLNEMPGQALVAVQRKLRDKSSPPRFLQVPRCRSKSQSANWIRKRCEDIKDKLAEGNDLPKKLAKALSVMNLYRKLMLRCVDISHSEFFPFTNGTLSLQNDVLNAIWSLPKVDQNDLKLLRLILGQGSKMGKKTFEVAVRSYLTECLFECDNGDLPDEALRAIAFLTRPSPKRHQVILTEERKRAEVEAILDLSSCLKSLTNCGTEGCSSDDEVSLGSDNCSEDNNFVLTEDYFNFGSQLQKMDEHCERIEDSGGVGHNRDSESAGSMMEPYSKNIVAATANSVTMTRCSEGLSVVCDETASLAHKLVGKIMRNMLLENKDVDALTGRYLGEGSISQVGENQKSDIVINAVQDLLPNLSKSCIDKVRRILNGGEP